MNITAIYMYKNIRLVCIFSLLFFGAQIVQAQNLEKLAELITFYPNKRAVEKDSTRYLQKFIAAPVVTFSPETSLAIGTGAKYLFKFNGSGEETRASNIPVSIRYSLNNQFIFFSGFEVFTNQEKWVIEGNLIFQNFPRLFYGIGQNTSEDNELEYNHNQFLAEPIFLKQLSVKHLFAGLGIRYNSIYNVDFDEDPELNEELNTDQISSFDGSTSAGIEAAILYDSRDNILNAEKGWFIEATYGSYDKVLGGTNKFQLTRFDVRHFRGLSEKSNAILGFQVLGSFSSGDVPFNELAALGGQEIMRGYREGRFVDRHILAGQMEYRKSFGDSRWGAVGFLGAGDVANSISNFNLKSIKPSYGAGIRFKLDKTENLNLRLDYGIGKGSSHFYFTIAEAF